MKPINEVYPRHAEDESKNGNIYGPGDYTPLLNSMGYDVLVKVDDDAYQGDSRVLFRDTLRYGILIFGWGSCSGCDALQACNSMKEIDDLRTDLNRQIRWFDFKCECLEYINKHDWAGDYAGLSSEVVEFIEKCRKELE